MRVSGTHRPIDDHDAAPTRIEAEGADWAAAREALRAQVPDGHQLLHITVEPA
jgi:hypothetical protein